jgi:hypothetical protein
MLALAALVIAGAHLATRAPKREDIEFPEEAEPRR